jgi:hypothetical protein
VPHLSLGAPSLRSLRKGGIPRPRPFGEFGYPHLFHTRRKKRDEWDTLGLIRAHFKIDAGLPAAVTRSNCSSKGPIESRVRWLSGIGVHFAILIRHGTNPNTTRN